MNLQLAQATRSQMKETNATFHLNLNNSETGNTDKLLLEFNHKELLDFYNKVRFLCFHVPALTFNFSKFYFSLQLEIIQNQFDSLS